MRKLVAIGTTAVLLTTGLSTPAWAAAPDVPTDVQVSWTDDGKVRVTWKDNGEANRVVAAFPDTGYQLNVVAADAPNELVFNPGALNEAPKVVIAVRAVGTDGEVSESGRSPLFDTHRVPTLRINKAQSLSTTAVRVWWERDAFVDETPNDPLDQPTGTWAKAIVTGPAAAQQTEFVVRGGVSTADVPVRRGPLTIKLSTGNEWGQTPAGEYLQTVRVGTMSVTSTLPAMTSFPGFGFKGTLQMSGIPASTGENFDVQVRPNSSAPWQTIGTGVGAYKPGTAIAAYTGASGGREYRLWVAATEYMRDDVYLVTPPASTVAKFIRRNTAIHRAGFSPATAQVSATVKLIVNVEPHVAMKAALQKWDGKKWVYLRAVQLDSKGNASIAIRAAGRGTTTKYRIATPPLKVNGLPVEVSTSKPFTLTVR